MQGKMMDNRVSNDLLVDYRLNQQLLAAAGASNNNNSSAANGGVLDHQQQQLLLPNFLPAQGGGSAQQQQNQQGGGGGSNDPFSFLSNGISSLQQYQQQQQVPQGGQQQQQSSMGGDLGSWINSLSNRQQNLSDAILLQQALAASSAGGNNPLWSNLSAMPMSNTQCQQQPQQQRQTSNPFGLSDYLAALTASQQPGGSASAMISVSNSHNPSSTNSSSDSYGENNKGIIMTSSTTIGGGHNPVVVYMDCDEESLSEYQCLLRKQLEFFEATAEDVQWNAQGRNKPIVLGQVGIRCRFCARLPTWSRARGAVYYSATLQGLYQAAQNLSKNHFCNHCRLIPESSKQKLVGLREGKRRAAGGKKYWAEGARVVGIRQYKDGLRFINSSTGKTEDSVQVEE